MFEDQSSPREPHAAAGGFTFEPIATEKIEHERKKFFIDLKENARGRVLSIVEDTNGRRNRIMLPAGAAREFVEALQRLADFEAKL
jgi:hypothetical protein